MSAVSCDFCEKSFCSKYNLERHKKVHTKEKPFSCKQCKKRFGRKEHLKNHMLTHNSIVERPFKCSECDRTFTRKVHLQTHMISHTEENPYQYQCSICEKYYFSEFHLKTHMHYHTKRRPIFCQECGQSCVDLEQLHIHQKKHDLVVYEDDTATNSDDTNTTLGSILDDEGNVIGYNKVDAQGTPYKSYFKPFACFICSKTFVDRDVCKTHMEACIEGKSSSHTDKTSKSISNKSENLEVDKSIKIKEEESNFEIPVTFIECKEIMIKTEVKEEVIEEDEIDESIPYSFPEEFDIKQEPEIETKVDTAEEPPKKKTDEFSCDQCGKMYKDIQLLNVHKWIHN